MSLLLLLVWQMHQAGEERLQGVIDEILTVNPELAWERQFPDEADPELAAQWALVETSFSYLESVGSDLLTDYIEDRHRDFESFSRGEEWSQIRGAFTPIVSLFDQGPLDLHRLHYLKQSDENINKNISKTLGVMLPTLAASRLFTSYLALEARISTQPALWLNRMDNWVRSRRPLYLIDGMIYLAIRDIADNTRVNLILDNKVSPANYYQDDADLNLSDMWIGEMWLNSKDIVSEIEQHHERLFGLVDIWFYAAYAHDRARNTQVIYQTYQQAEKIDQGLLPKEVDDPIYEWWSTPMSQLMLPNLQESLITHWQLEVHRSTLPVRVRIASDIAQDRPLPSSNEEFHQRYRQELDLLPLYLETEWQKHTEGRYLFTLPSSWRLPSLPEWERRQKFAADHAFKQVSNPIVKEPVRKSRRSRRRVAEENSSQEASVEEVSEQRQNESEPQKQLPSIEGRWPAVIVTVPE